MEYQLINDNYIVGLSDGAKIPKDTGNKDYQEYQKWLEEGNTPPLVARADGSGNKRSYRSIEVEISAKRAQLK